jgi:hypothetical protein
MRGQVACRFAPLKTYFNSYIIDPLVKCVQNCYSLNFQTGAENYKEGGRSVDMYISRFRGVFLMCVVFAGVGCVTTETKDALPKDAPKGYVLFYEKMRYPDSKKPDISPTGLAEVNFDFFEIQADKRVRLGAIGVYNRQEILSSNNSMLRVAAQPGEHTYEVAIGFPFIEITAPQRAITVKIVEGMITPVCIKITKTAKISGENKRISSENYTSYAFEVVSEPQRSIDDAKNIGRDVPDKK